MKIISDNYYKPSLYIAPQSNINFGKFNNPNKLLSPEELKLKDFLPVITIYDTGMRDNRLEGLIVEKREKMLKNCLVPPEYTYTDEQGVDRLKPHLFIKHIVVKPEFLRQGVCKAVEQKVIQLSKDEGFEGRVLLESSFIKGTENYIPNPALAHWANGFRFYGYNNAKQMAEVLNGNLPPEKAPGGTMYYPII